MTTWLIGLLLLGLTVLLVILLAGLGVVSRRADEESQRMHEDWAKRR